MKIVFIGAGNLATHLALQGLAISQSRYGSSFSRTIAVGLTTGFKVEL